MSHSPPAVSWPALIAQTWTAQYYAGPGSWELAEGRPRDDRPFELLAALGRDPGGPAWQQIADNIVADVLGPTPDPDDAADFRAELANHLRRVMKEADSEPPPHVMWFEGMYWYAFWYRDRPQPDRASRPPWWEAVLGSPPPPSPTLTPPPPSPPPLALPTKTDLDDFIQDEDQAHAVLKKILADLAAETVPLRRGDDRMSTLMFVYLVYRDLVGSTNPTPQAQELAAALGSMGYTTATGGAITADYLNTILSRVRKLVQARLLDAMGKGTLAVDEKWIELAFPRPNYYTPGYLFAPLPYPHPDRVAPNGNGGAR